MTKTVLVTGATSGIGLAFCKAYAKKGFTIILVARTSAKLFELSKELSGKYDVETHYFTQDLSLKNAALDLFQSIRKRNLKIDILINNAGFSNTGLFSSISLEKLHHEMVVKATFKALKQHKPFVVDGFSNKLKSLIPRILSRKAMAKITGSSGEKAWYN